MKGERIYTRRNGKRDREGEKEDGRRKETLLTCKLYYIIPLKILDLGKDQKYKNDELITKRTHSKHFRHKKQYAPVTSKMSQSINNQSINNLSLKEFVELG